MLPRQLVKESLGGLGAMIPMFRHMPTPTEIACLAFESSRPAAPFLNSEGQDGLAQQDCGPPGRARRQARDQATTSDVRERPAERPLNEPCARKCRDVAEDQRTPISVAGSSERYALDDSSAVVDDERLERFRLDLVGDDRQRSTNSLRLLKNRHDVPCVSDAAVKESNEAVCQGSCSRPHSGRARRCSGR